MKRLRAGGRGLRLVAHLLLGLAAAALLRLDVAGWVAPERAMSWWNRGLLRILKLRLAVRGAPLAGARFTVANHVSWLDIPVIGACEPTRFLSKSEVARWPIAGWLANACGTFYIRRGQGGARPLLAKLVPHLAAGGSVVIFPEGTTGNGSQLLPFHPRLFAAALAAGCPVQPIAIRYSSDLAPFIGDDDLFSHLLRLLQEPELTAELVYCAPIDPRGLDRDGLCARARQAVHAELGALPLEIDLGTPQLAA